MTKPTAEQVAAWAKEAEVTGVRTSPENEIGYRMFQELQRFAAKAYAAGQAAERDACAKVCDEQAELFRKGRNGVAAYGSVVCAEAIRARGQQ